MPQNPRNQSEHGRKQYDERGRDDMRRQNASYPARSSNEEDMERGSDKRRRDNRSWLMSSIDYDLNAE